MAAGGDQWTGKNSQKTKQKKNNRKDKNTEAIRKKKLRI